MKARPLRGAELAAMLAEIDARAARDVLALRDAAMITTMRDAMLRGGEAAALRLSSVVWMPDCGAVLDLGVTKTGPERYRPRLRPTTQHRLARWIADGHRHDGGPLFELASTKAVARRIAQLARVAGLGGPYSGHSIRRGAAHDLFDSGESLPAIMRLGRWRSAQTATGYADELGDGPHPALDIP